MEWRTVHRTSPVAVAYQLTLDFNSNRSFDCRFVYLMQGFVTRVRHRFVPFHKEKVDALPSKYSIAELSLE
jgi:hypothetical protein